MDRRGPLLLLQGVSVAYRRGHRALPVLADVSLGVAAGEVVAVLAMRGQGCSTLLRVAAGMQQPDGGRVVFGGEDLWRLAGALRQRLLRAEIGWVEASTPDVDIEMLDHVATPLLVGRGGKRRAYALACSALERVGASACAGRRWDALSDGERALVAVAVAIVRGPRLLVVDDLTATLGLGETDEVARLLHELARERRVGVLMGVSDASATPWSDRLAMLAGGELTVVPSEEEPAGASSDLPGGGERWGWSGL